VVGDCGGCDGESGSESSGAGDGWEGAVVGVVGGGSGSESGGHGVGVVEGGGSGRWIGSVVPGKSKASGCTVFGDGGGVTSSQWMAVDVGDAERTVMTGLSERMAGSTSGRAGMRTAWSESES